MATHDDPDDSPVVAMNQTEFTELYRRHLGSVRAYASALVAASDVDDVAAEAFAVAWQRRDAIPQDWAQGWLIGVTRNIVRTRRRSARRAAGFIDQLCAARPAQPAGPADAALASERFDALEQAMRSLRPHDQEILMFTGPYAMSAGDIAAALDITENAVGVRLHRARRRLRDAFDLTMQQGGEVA